NGVVIDFEGFYPSDRTLTAHEIETNRQAFVSWLTDLKTVLHPRGISLSVCLPPALYQGQYFDYYGISQAADEIILMEHDYSDNSSPSEDSPINLIRSDIQKLTLDYQVPGDKIILQLSLANTQYKKYTIGSENYFFKAAQPSLTTIRNTINSINAGGESAGTIVKHIYNAATATCELVFDRTENVTAGGTTYSGTLVTNDIFYLDEKSIAARINLVNELNLRGLSLWKLGYNNYYDNSNTLVKNTYAWDLLTFKAPPALWGYSGETSNDASLSELQLSGAMVPGFTPVVTEYNVVLPYGTTEIPTIIAYQNHSQASDPVIVNPKNLPGTSTIQVKAPDGSTCEYKVNFSVASPTQDECFIATAAFGSKFEPAVVLLRHFRDHFLLSNRAGRAFVRFYYRTSPPIAAFIAGSEVLKAMVRILLIPLILVAYMLFHPLLLIAFIIAVFMLVPLRRQLQFK
ncbi:MAG: CFI-box-CTERM domain-containing protein, partial [Syntrophomonas sp.]